jgi:hypothetical protein
MQRVRHPTAIPDESIDERASREVTKLIRKLRWIGKEDEASELESKLQSTRAGDCVLAAPRDTD